MPNYTKPQIEYNWIQDVEALEHYEPGGYHPITVGDTLHDGRYYIADKLGHGAYSTVWLARDTPRNRYVALKVNTASSVLREARVLRALSKPPSPGHPGRRSIPDLLDEFEVRGPNGTHICYTVTLAACNLRKISYRLVQAVAYVHSQGYVHGDIHLNNILLALPSSIDDLPVEQLYEKYGYGRPQTIPVTPINTNSNALPPNIPAQAVQPLVLGQFLDPLTPSTAHLLLSDFGEALHPAEYIPADEIVAQHVDVLGPMPPEWWLRWAARDRFFVSAQGQPTESYREDKWPPLEEWFEVTVQKWRRRGGSAIAQDERAAFLDLMRGMLVYRPEERLSVDEVLRSKWMVRWALPGSEEGAVCT
ncbi:kinase-like protein [Aspergillus homomorphus CBS 101889]|uniref:non-specific serine/threonine protein kinase n=1 Tax=Aspergillus homomorphus (strain CBS 101889) TaxID=1450537 RepID=A0A395I8K8_ASPHC|nr:kinase-like protein [Aspergillus homomorphus CBS 101889]RAL16295.1 kinase-like protein [Aspergillus homomorphus CBS 101889]